MGTPPCHDLMGSLIGGISAMPPLGKKIGDDQTSNIFLHAKNPEFLVKVRKNKNGSVANNNELILEQKSLQELETLGFPVPKVIGGNADFLIKENISGTGLDHLAVKKDAPWQAAQLMANLLYKMDQLESFPTNLRLNNFVFDRKNGRLVLIAPGTMLRRTKDREAFYHFINHIKDKNVPHFRAQISFFYYGLSNGGPLTKRSPLEGLLAETIVSLNNLQRWGITDKINDKQLKVLLQLLCPSWQRDDRLGHFTKTFHEVLELAVPQFKDIVFRKGLTRAPAHQMDSLLSMAPESSLSEQAQKEWLELLLRLGPYVHTHNDRYWQELKRINLFSGTDWSVLKKQYQEILKAKK